MPAPFEAAPSPSGSPSPSPAPARGGARTVVLVTGANRGLGLALVQAYLRRGDCRVLAGCRKPGKLPELEGLQAKHPQALTLLRLDVNLGRSVKAAAEVAADHVDRLDVLINNAGVFPGPPRDTLEKLDLAFARDAFETNALGPVRVTRDFLPLLRRSERPRVVNVTSGAGSLSRQPVLVAGQGVNYAYAASKAALNVLTRLLAHELAAERVCTVAMTPGWVRTEMGGSDAPVSAEESARAMVESIEGLTMEQTAQWLDRHGAVSEYAW